MKTKKMTLQQVLDWNNECMKIAKNPKIIALQIQDRKIADRTYKQREKIKAKIEALQNKCEHSYNWNLSYSCLKCGCSDPHAEE